MAKLKCGPVRVSLGLALVGILLAPAAPAQTVEATCQEARDIVAVEAGPGDERAATLPSPFGVRPWPVDRAALLDDTEQRVNEELVAIGAPACYTARVARIASRAAFLAPFEFLVAGYYDRDPERRDALLTLYRDDPRQALGEISDIWPSPRAEQLARSLAFFDLDTDQVYLNTGAVPAEWGANVLAHEFWHALPDLHFGTRTDGSRTRRTGFWTEARSDDDVAWGAVEENFVFGVPTYLMNEAVAIEMEVAATGQQHAWVRLDLARATDELDQLFAVAGRDHVLRLYLESRAEELKAIARLTTSEPTNRTGAPRLRATFAHR